MKKTAITTILFDFGRVLLPLDVEATYDAFKALGAKPSLNKEYDLFKKWERGTISPKEFVAELRKELKYASHENSIWKAWNAMILNLPQENLNLLKRLKKKYKLILVSNINEEHEAFIRHRFGLFTYKQFIKQFDAVYYSHRMGKRKPENAFFTQVIEEQKLAPESCLFVDDTLENINAAKKLNLQTWFFNPDESSLSDLDKVLQAHH